MSEKVTVKVERSVLHLPAIALRGLVVFPNNLVHFEVGREKSIAAGLEFEHFILKDACYRLKKNRIPGFKGSIVIYNRLSGFHSELAGALLHYAAYSGAGIKTTLGMGAVRVDKL